MDQSDRAGEKTQSSDFPLDIDALASGWHSLVLLPINLVEFPPALKKIGNTIQTRFYDPEPYYALSHLQMLEQAGQHEVIIKNATTALLNTKLPNSIKSRILGIRGGSFADTGNIKDALKDIRKAISLDRSNINLLVNLGYTFLKFGNNEEAYRALSRAIKKDPNMELHIPIGLWHYGSLGVKKRRLPIQTLQ
jgi:tetratricopeptide (TPR) repeat protein